MNEVPRELVPVHLFRARWCSGVFVIVMMPLKETRGQTPARTQLERNVRWMLARWFDGFGNFGSQPANHPSIPSWVSLCVAVLRYEDVKILKLICPGIARGVSGEKRRKWFQGGIRLGEIFDITNHWLYGVCGVNGWEIEWAIEGTRKVYGDSTPLTDVDGRAWLEGRCGPFLELVGHTRRCVEASQSWKAVLWVSFADDADRSRNRLAMIPDRFGTG